jgi:hypothetical protein
MSTFANPNTTQIFSISPLFLIELQPSNIEEAGTMSSSNVLKKTEDEGTNSGQAIASYDHTFGAQSAKLAQLADSLVNKYSIKGMENPRGTMESRTRESLMLMTI